VAAVGTSAVATEALQSMKAVDVRLPSSRTVVGEED
jgi:hypothetical protein